MFIATLETPNYDFLSLGHTEEEARQALADAWAVHAEQTGADPDYLEDNSDSINISEIKPGQCLRDHDIIAFKPKRRT